MSSEEDLLSFSGSPGEKPTQFIQNINRRAFAQGKSRDDEWIAQYASICLADDALEWYYTLSDEVQNSGKKLFAALLKDFSNRAAAKPVESESDISTAFSKLSTGEPAAASSPARAGRPVESESDIFTDLRKLSEPPAPAAAPPPLPPRASSASTPMTRTGYIEYADAITGVRLGYVSKNGDKTFSENIEDALLLELPTAASPTLPVSMRVLNSALNDPDRSYAGILELRTPLDWWMLVLTPPGTNGWQIPGMPDTALMSNVWTVHPLSDTLELKLWYPGFNGARYPAQRLYMGQYMPVDSIARTFVDRNPKPRPEDMVNAYRKSDIPKMVGFRKLRMIFRPA